ncbi:membrane-spanning 4-domains subfamily A member 4A isoform X1 [Centroberyx affinis]|uniref:membrane-spanning 4-domains subfamily A member 4A isoform X1 n=1 Tax=Centroberyx affinis TaxID=166261 RepID=UPI003A5C0833
MKHTFKSDESMVITIPIGSLKEAQEGQLLPEKFHCVFKDTYKVFVVKGKPKPFGAAQAIAGVFVFSLGLLLAQSCPRRNGLDWLYTIPSVLFVISGVVSYAAGHSPNMHVTKLSFSLNIISFFWSVVAVSLCALLFHDPHGVKVSDGIKGMIAVLLVVEMIIALFLIYWLSKTVCRQHFNTLPIIMLRQEVRTA